jgi:hypothetical protein
MQLKISIIKIISFARGPLIGFIKTAYKLVKVVKELTDCTSTSKHEGD